MADLLTHSALRANLWIGLFLLALPGCTAGPWEKEFWSPPAASGAAPITGGPQYPIQRATGTMTGWPNLGDVPDREAAPLDAAAEAGQLQALQADRASAQAQDQAVRAARPSSGSTVKAADIAIPAQTPTPPPEIGE